MKFSLSFALLALPLLVTAGPLIGRATPATASSCNGGSTLQCCNSVKDAHDPDVVSALGGLGLLIKDISVPVGLGCSPLTIIGLTNTCAQQTVCCKDNTFNSLVAIGCSPLLL